MTSADLLLERATEISGLGDFGDLGIFRPGLSILLDALSESHLDLEERATLEGLWIARLVLRLRLVNFWANHPELAGELLEGPLVVIGLPRTGTTPLIDLLSSDPQARTMRQWETANLLPPPTRECWPDDPRIETFEKSVNAHPRPFQKLGLHALGALLPDECNTVLALDFWGPNGPGTPVHLPGYAEWLKNYRPLRPYHTHRSVLRHLQAHGPTGRWTLKSPFHLFAVPELLAEYPDAMLVQIHRDPCEVFPSICGLYTAARDQLSVLEGRAAIGAPLLDMWAAGLQRCVRDRQDPAVNSRVLDISYNDFSSNPIATARAIYDHFGLPVSDETLDAFRSWVDRPTQQKSRASFTLKEFGLTREDVERATAHYYEEYKEYL